MKLTLIGKALTHSQSPKIWERIFTCNNVNGTFTISDIPSISHLQEIIKEKDLDGFTVTIPYKQEIIPLLHSISPEAKAIGAINAVQIIEGKLHGYNTDLIGYERLLAATAAKASVDLQQKLRTLILGHGGAAKAVIYAHHKMGHDITIVSRHADKNVPSIAYEDISTLQPYDIIVNTTPLGMFPNTETYPAIPYSTIRQNTIAIDLVYNPQFTTFCKLCSTNGAIAQSGLLMLEQQAEAFFEIILNNNTKISTENKL